MGTVKMGVEDIGPKSEGGAQNVAGSQRFGRTSAQSANTGSSMRIVWPDAFSPEAGRSRLRDLDGRRSVFKRLRYESVAPTPGALSATAASRHPSRSTTTCAPARTSDIGFATNIGAGKTERRPNPRLAPHPLVSQTCPSQARVADELAPTAVELVCVDIPIAHGHRAPLNRLPADPTHHVAADGDATMRRVHRDDAEAGATSGASWGAISWCVRGASSSESLYKMSLM